MVISILYKSDETSLKCRWGEKEEFGSSLLMVGVRMIPNNQDFVSLNSVALSMNSKTHCLLFK